jgi:hypothetical protein
MTEVLGHLSPFVPPSSVSLPSNSVRLVKAKGRPLSLGHRRGTEYRAGAPISAQKGLHLDASVRFEVWGSAPNDVDDSVQNLQSSLLAATDDLRAFGFLKFSVADTGSAEHIDAESAWRKSAEFSFLYEFHFQDGDDAESFLVRIPVQSHLEAAGLAGGSLETITEPMRRWDGEGAAALVLRGGNAGRNRIFGISSYTFNPSGAPGDQVVVERLTNGSPAAPTVHASFDDFLDAVTDPVSPQRHDRFTFASLAAFLAALDTAGDPFPLGDWDEDLALDSFVPLRRRFDPPIVLHTGRDHFAIRYQSAALPGFDIVYLRALLSRGEAG